MFELFNLQNWSDFTHEDGFWGLTAFIIVSFIALMAMLFAENIKSWRDHRQERAKWESFQRN